MDKLSYFTKEIDYIKDEKRKEDLKYLINLLPDYFFDIPASSTGKYHPTFAKTKHGLLKHTKLAVRFAYELLCNNTIGCKFTDTEKDLIIMALVLHDGLKKGDPEEKYTRIDHPLLISNLIMSHAKELSLDIDDTRKMCSMIESHMGEWNYDYLTKKEVLPKPKNELERFVHMCDYLASRKCFDIKFNNLDL